MKKSIGLLEYKSIAKGIEAADGMIKAANIELLLSTPICPGKYITIISGEVGAVKNAIEVGKNIGNVFVVSHHVIMNVSETVFPAITATLEIDKISSLGVIETMSAISSIVVGDIAVKAANVQLLEIRLARGLGGKGFVILTGEIASVKSAIKACEAGLEYSGDIISAVAIASPSKALIEKLM